MAHKGERRRIIEHTEVTVSRQGNGESSTVLVAGLPPMAQADARWLLDALSRVVVMPPNYFKDARDG